MLVVQQIDFNFGIVDISSGMKRIENSKEAFRNLTLIADDGVSEYSSVILTPSHWYATSPCVTYPDELQLTLSTWQGHHREEQGPQMGTAQQQAHGNRDPSRIETASEPSCFARGLAQSKNCQIYRSPSVHC